MISEAFSERGARIEKPTRDHIAYGQLSDLKECDVPTRSGISEELQKVRDLINAAHEYATILEQRTAPFRRLSPQCEAKEHKIPRQSGSELTEELSAHNERLQVLCNRMSAMIDEIDL